MRLIDADALIEAMKKTESEYENAMTCPSWWSAFNVISEQPTAYDIDKVVEELNELEVKENTRYKNGDFGDFDGVDYYIKKSDAIEIVKQGVVSDDVCELKSDYGFISDKYKRETQCGYTFYDLHHAVAFKYCPYCSKKIKVVE